LALLHRVQQAQTFNVGKQYRWRTIHSTEQTMPPIAS
jgi:hypothetical protein